MSRREADKPRLVELPIDAVLAELVETVEQQGRVVLEAPTGAGKTTRVPPALLAAVRGRVLVLEPRRVAARTAAFRIAQERSWTLGEEVGYQIRFERRASSATRVLFVTEGVLLRMMQDDPFLEDVGCVVFDEFHERNLQSDTALALLRRLQDDVRPELRLLLMSATLATREIADALKATFVRSEGRSHPIEISYLPREDPRPAADQVAAAVLRALRDTALADGSILAFLPGLGEIRRAHSLLDQADCPIPIFDLYGDLPLEQQTDVLRSSTRRVVLATNVAETSVTVAGVTTVIDSGVHRQLRFDPSSGIDRLQLLPISKASADQRAGRAGREAPGRALRLWTESQHSVRIGADPPEIERVDFSATHLYLRAQHEDPKALPWLNPPSSAAQGRATQLLTELGALDHNTVTREGAQMASMPLHPRLARLLIAAAAEGLVSDGARLAALLSERDIFVDRDPNGTTSDSDLLDRLVALDQRGPSAVHVHRGRARQIERVAQQLLRLATPAVKEASPPRWTNSASERRERLARCLLVAFPDRLAMFAPTPGLQQTQSRMSQPTGRLVGGGGVVLSRQSRLHLKPNQQQLVLCEQLGGEFRHSDRRFTTVRSATLIDHDWLDPALIKTQERATFDPSTKRIVGQRVVTYGATSDQPGLTLERNDGSVSDEKAAQVLAAAVLKDHVDGLGLEEEAVAQFLRRLDLVREHDLQLDFPVIDDSFLQDAILQVCQGARSFGEVRAAFARWLPSQLTYQQSQRLDQLAPKRLALPNGRSAQITYSASGETPVLAARIQDLFGWQDTPTICGGKVRLMLHLLAPNHRPQQVTDDLRGFWCGSYELVRKELAGRYPKHPWPKDPLNAEPTVRNRRHTSRGRR